MNILSSERKNEMETLPQYEYGEPKTENRKFDPEVEPTEKECNTCGWRGCPSSAITMRDGETREELSCPRCRKYTEVSEWNVVGADPFDQWREGGQDRLEPFREEHAHRKAERIFNRERVMEMRQAGASIRQIAEQFWGGGGDHHQGATTLRLTAQAAKIAVMLLIERYCLE